MSKSKAKVWIELLFRHTSWRGWGDIKPLDYTVKGGALPGPEFPTVSSAFTMFREIPEGLEDYFDRPMRTKDIVQLVSLWPNGCIKTIPLLILNRSDAHQCAGENSTFKWQEVSGSPEYVATIVPGSMLLNQIQVWKSRLINSKVQ